jgi:putative heme-binding domain-containing protein
MPRFLLSSSCVLLLTSSLAAEPPKISFRVPAGFVAEKIAGSPQVEHPVFACFDDRGRLYVADNAGMNLNAEQLLKQLPNCIRLLESTKGDGVYDKSTVFADKMSMPMGVLWHDGAVYSCSPPSLWKLEDTTGKGVCDKRTELVTKFGFTGNAADIHGPFLGPDGLFYWTDGRHGHEIRAGGGTMKGKAARIFRCKPDGTNVEVVCGGGMDDPVEMAFTEEGEPFAVVDIFEARPARVDALIYCIDGGVFPYYEAVLGEFKRTGPLLPAVSELGWVAPSGLTRYRSAVFGKEYTDNLFSTQFNKHKVMRHILERDGAGFKSKDEDFITSDDPDFHPTSVREDADGSLIVIDTGGWFRIGCPTSVVAKPEIKGGIYRIRKKDAPKVEDPYGLRIPWEEAPAEKLIRLLDDTRPAVRDKSIQALVHRGETVINLLFSTAKSGATARLRRNAIWTLCRIGPPESLKQLISCVNDISASVQQVTARVLGIHRCARNVFPGGMAFYATPAVRRELAICFGRNRNPTNVGLVSLLHHHTNDRFLEHSVIHALIEIGNRKDTAELFKNQSATPRMQRTLLIALDQMENGNLTKEEVLPFLSSDDRALQQAAWEIVLKHTDWLPDVASEIRKELVKPTPAGTRSVLAPESLARAARVAEVQSLVREMFVDRNTPAETRGFLLDVIATAAVEKLPAAWADALRMAAWDPAETIVRHAIDVIRTRAITDCDDVLNAIVADPKKPADLRIAALSVTGPRLKALAPDLFDLLLVRLRSEAATDRLSAAQALGQAPLSADQLTALCDLMPKATALEFPRLLAAFERGGSAELGRKLVAALVKSPALASLSPSALRDALKSFPAEVRTAAEPLFKKLAVDDAAQRNRLMELADVWKAGDAARGRAVFFGKTAACAACHAVGGFGEKIGPDLSKIGQIRTETDLLEAVLFPSNSIVRGYESFMVHLTDGKSYTGVIRRETADTLYLVTPERTEVRVARKKIESLEPSRVSIMPAGLDAQLSREDLGDLITFLKSLK